LTTFDPGPAAAAGVGEAPAHRGGVSIARELYAGILVDRGCGRVVVMASAAGGMEIEEVAGVRPEAIVKNMSTPALAWRLSRRAS